MSGQADKGTSTWQHTKITRDRSLCLRRDSNQKSQEAREGTFIPYAARTLVSIRDPLSLENNAIFLLSTTNKIHRYTILFIIVNALYVSGVSPPIIRSSRTLHTASGMCQACLLLPLAVAANKPGTYQMLCVKFLSSWWWAEKPPKHIGHWQ